MTMTEHLGGRLPLLHPNQLEGDTRNIYELLAALVGPEATEAGFRAQLDDGRLIGPFNAMLYTPALTTGLGQWIARINAAGIDPRLREVIILTIAGHWDARYEIYAHTAGARTTGLSENTIRSLLAGQVPADSSPIVLAHRLTHAMVVDHSAPEELYQEVVGEFGVEGAIGILHLIAQYQLISALLVFFDVPVPRPSP